MRALHPTVSSSRHLRQCGQKAELERPASSQTLVCPVCAKLPVHTQNTAAPPLHVFRILPYKCRSTNGTQSQHRSLKCSNVSLSLLPNSVQCTWMRGKFKGYENQQSFLGHTVAWAVWWRTIDRPTLECCREGRFRNSRFYQV